MDYDRDIFDPKPTTDRPRTEADPPFGERIAELGRTQEARRLLIRLEREGFVFTLTEPDGVRVHPRPDDATVEILKAMKPGIVAALKGRA